MQVLGVPFDHIDLRLLERLLADRIDESLTHDYKSRLPDPRDVAAKGRLLKSVTALANTTGGVIIIGFDAPPASEWSMPGLAGFDSDRDIDRLDKLVRAGCEPIVGAVRFRVLPRDGADPLLLVGVPRSLASPHAIPAEHGPRFWARGERGNHDMSVGELRDAFGEAGRWMEEAERFRAARLERAVTVRVAQDIETPQGSLYVHALPLGRLRQMLPMMPLALSAEPPWWSQRTGGFGMGRANLEGYLRYSTGFVKGGHVWVQHFRHGGIEIVSGLTRIGVSAPGKNVVVGYDAEDLEKTIVGSVSDALDWLRFAQVAPPIALMATMHAFHGAQLQSRRGYLSINPRFDRAEIELPPLVWETLPEPSTIATSVRPLLDLVWQAGGRTESLFFEADGRWKLNLDQ